MSDSLAEFFLQHFRAHAHECAFRQRRGYRTESFTYGEVMKMAFGFAHVLQSRGIAKCDLVMLRGQNSAEWVAAFFGCVLVGVVVVPMDEGASADFAMRVFRQVDGKMLIASRKHLSNPPTDRPSFAFEDLRPSNADQSPRPAGALTGSDILQIVFTSGTTADPRGVVITHANVLANIAPLEHEMQAYRKYERLVHPLRFLHLLPLSHVFGQFLGMYLPPLLGATVIFQDELKPSEIVDAARRERVSVLVCVPRMLQSLKQKIEREIEDHGQGLSFRRRFVASKDHHFLRRWWTFRAIRRQFGWKFWAFICGGATLDSETEEFWQRLGYAAIQGYGLTETTSLVSVNHPFKLGKGSIGKVLPGREVKLADDGEILVRGAGVVSGYWNENARQDVSDEQGWYRTGDVGALDEAGNLYFKGRKKEVIVTPGGTNVYPEDLEAALRAQPEVRDCVVVGIDRGGNAEPCAVVILRGDADEKRVTLEQIVRRANESLAEYQRMNMWMEWPQPDFPRTNTQKPKRNVITETVRLQMSKPDSKPVGSANNPLSALIAKISGRAVAGVSKDASLDSDLGLSSLDRVELLGALEDRYQIDLRETRFSDVKTVGDLERMLRGEAAPGVGYHYPNWALRWPVTWMRWLAHYLLMRPAIILLGWPRIEGREHLRGVNGPLLVVCNHLADIDPGFVLTALPARFRNHLAVATGGEALEALRTASPDRTFFLRIYDRVQWMLGVSLLNLFPLPRDAGFRRSFVYAGEAVDRGYSVLVFPEGRHTTDGKMNPFRSGIGLLALNLGIPVLPLRIDGLYEAKQAGKKFVAPWKIGVKIGKPMQFDASVAPEQIAAQLQQAVSEL